jgi:CDP-2,3-bis-(O-geranylgeranyl)-sn-glycerol synthase
MQSLVVAQLLLLLTLANGSPVIARLIWGARFSGALDCGATFIDGRPLLGPAKTIRGLVVALAVTAAGGALLGLGFSIGLLVGAAAMAGDLFSSFVKRRLGMASSSRATGLDQIPESLFPLLACRTALSLTAADMLAVCAVFFVGEILLSRVLYRLHVRERPY